VTVVGEGLEAAEHEGEQHARALTHAFRREARR
jgi:hypothetical protein